VNVSHARVLVVNADDFGYSPGVNRAIVQAHRDGIVTSTSLMVRPAAARAAVDMSREYPDLSLGLHLDLGEWAFEQGEWRALYAVVDTGDAERVSEEIDRQLAAFRSLVGRDPSHIDSHQHTHLRPIVRPIVKAVARTLGVPLRHCTEGITYCGRFYGQTTEGMSLPDSISAEALKRILRELGHGVTELACHPGEGDDVGTMYRSERRAELDALCDPGVVMEIAAAGLELRSFGSLGPFSVESEQT
jgi:chitin disaccharide deacetylase